MLLIIEDDSWSVLDLSGNLLRFSEFTLECTNTDNANKCFVCYFIHVWKLSVHCVFCFVCFHVCLNELTIYSIGLLITFVIGTIIRPGH